MQKLNCGIDCVHQTLAVETDGDYLHIPLEVKDVYVNRRIDDRTNSEDFTPDSDIVGTDYESETEEEEHCVIVLMDDVERKQDGKRSTEAPQLEHE